MSLFLPDMYKKSIFDINYKLLKKKGIKVLIFDFDNTLVEKERDILTSDTKKLLNDLKKDFDIVIVTNIVGPNKVEKLHKCLDPLNISFINFSVKPSKKGYKKAMKMFCYDKSSFCAIGDQFLTDVLGAKRFGIFSILVDGISNNELAVTKFNRIIEKKVLKSIHKKYGFEKEKYYD